MAKAKKVTELPIVVPANRAEAESLAEDLAALIRAQERADSEAADKISAIKAELKRVAAARVTAVKRRLAVLAAWATANRDGLCGERKSFVLGAGTAGWRATPPKLEIDDEEMVVLALQELERDDVLRQVVEIDKDALKRDPELIGLLAGVRVTSTERFFFTPLDVDGGVETTVKVA